MKDRPTLELHPDAARNFDAKAKTLLSRLAPEASGGRDSGPNISPDAHVSAHLTDEDILEDGITKMHGDQMGRVTGMFFFEEEQRWIGLEGAAYSGLVQLAEAIQKCSSIADHVSVRFIEERIFDWLKQEYRSNSHRPLTTALLEDANSAIDEWEMWIPIPTLSTLVEFPLGRMVFRPITKRLVDSWCERLRTRSSETSNLDDWIDQLRKKIQGLAAATITVVAEPIRASEIALEESERTVAGLRLFAPELLHPYGRSFWAPVAFIDRTGVEVIRLRDGFLEGRLASAPLDVAGHRPFDREMLDTASQMGLARVDELLRRSDLTPFERDCLNSLFQYSKAALTRDPSEKLLYVVSALESILLRETHEGGLGKNLEERLAIFIRSDLRERTELVRRVKTIYKLRSDFVHKSLAVKHFEIMREFMIDGWTTFRNLLRCSGQYYEKEDFLRDLEEQRLVGPAFSPHQFRIVQAQSDESE